MMLPVVESDVLFVGEWVAQVEVLDVNAGVALPFFGSEMMSFMRILLVTESAPPLVETSPGKSMRLPPTVFLTL
jgi:hypothetical protein